MLCYLVLCGAKLCYIVLYSAVLCHIVLCCSNSRYVELCCLSCVMCSVALCCTKRLIISRRVKYLSIIKVHPEEGLSVDRDWTWSTVNEFHSGFACFCRRRALTYGLKKQHVTRIKVNLLVRKLKQSREEIDKQSVVLVWEEVSRPVLSTGWGSIYLFTAWQFTGTHFYSCKKRGELSEFTWIWICTKAQITKATAASTRPPVIFFRALL